MISDPYETEIDPNTTLNLISERRSVRSFTDQTVTNDQILKLLETVRHAPSGGNMQPWRVHVLGKSTISILRQSIENHIEKNGFSDFGDYRFYPDRKKQSYWQHIKQSGKDLHDQLGIQRRDTQKIRAQKRANFRFYGAPVGLIVTLNRELEKGSWVDVGLFLGILTTAISSVGLGCCVQGSFSSYGDIVRSTLSLDQDDLVICGVAIGHPRADDPINQLPHRRLKIDEFVRFHT